MKFLKENWGKVLWVLFWWIALYVVPSDDPTRKETIWHVSSIGLICLPPLTLYLCERKRISDGMAWAVGSTLLLYLGFAWFLLKNFSKLTIPDSEIAQKEEQQQKQLALRRAQAEALNQSQISALSSGGRVEISSSDLPFLIRSNDFVLYKKFGMQIYTAKSVRQYVGGHAGVSFRVAKGVTIRTGGNQGASESVMQQQKLGDSCVFAITNQYIFVKGDDGNIKRMERASVTGFENFSDGIGITFSKYTPLSLVASESDCACIRAACAFEQS